MVRRLWLVTASVHATDEKLVWADSKEQAMNEADFDSCDLEWECRSAYEASPHDIQAHQHKSVYDRDADRYRDVQELADLCSETEIERREREAREKAEFDAHPKLLEV